MLLHFGQRFIAFLEILQFLFLIVESPYDTHTGEVLPGHGKQLIQSGLDLFIKRCGELHDPEDHQPQQRNGDDEDKGCLNIDREGHDHSAKNNKGRTQQQPECQIQSGLHLVDITGYAGQKCCRTDSLGFAVGK